MAVPHWMAAKIKLVPPCSALSMLLARSKCSLIRFLCHGCLSLSLCLSSVCLSTFLPVISLPASLSGCLSSSICVACREILGFLLLGCGWRGWGGLAAGLDLMLPFSLPPPPTPLLTSPSPSAVFLVSEPGPHGPASMVWAQAYSVRSSIHTPHPCLRDVLSFTHR